MGDFLPETSMSRSAIMTTLALSSAEKSVTVQSYKNTHKQQPIYPLHLPIGMCG